MKPKYQVRKIDKIPMPKNSMPGTINLMEIEKENIKTYSAYLDGVNGRCYNIPEAGAQYGLNEEQTRIKITMFVKWAKKKYKNFKNAITSIREG